MCECVCRRGEGEEENGATVEEEISKWLLAMMNITISTKCFKIASTKSPTSSLVSVGPEPEAVRASPGDESDRPSAP